MKIAEKNLRLLNILAFLFAFRTFEGVWALYFATITNSYSTAMTLFAVMHIASSTMEMPTGLLADRIGRKKTIILYFLVGFLATLLFYLANSTLVLAAGAALVGLSMALGSGTFSAYVYENLTELGKVDLYKKFEGKRRAQSRYAMVTAGLLGTVIIYFYDIRTAILASLLVIFVGLVLSFFLKDIHTFKPDKSNIYHSFRQALGIFIGDFVLRDISLGKIFARGLGNSEYRFRTLFFSAIMPEWLVNLVGILNNLISGIAMHANHFIVSKLGIKKSLIHLDLFDRGLVTICILIYSTASSIVMNVISSISFGIRDVSAEDLLQARYSKEQRATMGSLIGLSSSLLYTVAAITAGFAADKIGLFYTMLLFQPLLLISTYFFSRGLNRINT